MVIKTREEMKTREKTRVLKARQERGRRRRQEEGEEKGGKDKDGEY